jgi:hypothetical protein
MEATWQTPRYMYWRFPKPVPTELVRYHAIALGIRKRYAAIWAKPANASERARRGLANDDEAFERLGKIIERGYFVHTDQQFIRQWQGKMKRKRANTSLAGIISCIKWLGITDSGFRAMQSELIKAAYLQGRAARDLTRNANGAGFISTGFGR